LLQHETLVGVLLGDGSLFGNKAKTKYSLRIVQSDFHKEYVFHLYGIFKELVTIPPKRYDFLDRRSPGKVYSRWSFRTYTLACFTPYAVPFYSAAPNSKKIVPKDILLCLTPRAIAY
jgi:hypothetical protein